MPRVTGSIDTPGLGVSQLPAERREPGQCAESINSWPSDINTVAFRDPTKLVSQLGSTTQAPYRRWIDVSANESYLMLLCRSRVPGNPLLYMALLRDGTVPATVDVHGTGLSMAANPATTPDGQIGHWIEIAETSYLASTAEPDPIGLLGNYAVALGGPFAILANRIKTVRMNPAVSPSRSYEALIFIKSAVANTTLTLTIDGQSTSFTPQAGSSLSTTQILQDLVNEWRNAHDNGATSVYEFHNTRYVSWVKRVDGSSFTISLDDGLSNTTASAIQNSVVSTAELPTLAPDGFKLLQIGSAGVDVDDVWVEFRTRDQSSFGDGTWQETIAPGIPFELDIETMPLLIRRAAQDVLFVGPADGASRQAIVNGQVYDYDFPKWLERTAGDLTTSPDPAFVGQRIRDLGLFRGRLVIASDTRTLSNSELNIPFNFFPKTIQAALETDPFELLAPAGPGAVFDWLLVGLTGVMVFAADSQYMAEAGSESDVYTARSAKITQVAEVSQNLKAKPVTAASNVFFSADTAAGFSRVNEYPFSSDSLLRNDLLSGATPNITEAVPKYIKGSAISLTVSEESEYLVLLTEHDPRTLYVYRYSWSLSGGRRVKSQSAWNKWTFSKDIASVEFLRSTLTILFREGLELCSLQVTQTQLQDNTIYTLDRQVEYPGCNANSTTTDDVVATYDVSLDKTTFVLPYEPKAPLRAIVSPDNANDAFLVVGTLDANSGTTLQCTANGDFTGHCILIGETYNFLHEFSKVFRRDRDNSGRAFTGDPSGYLQLKSWTIHHHNTGYYDLVVDRFNRQPTRKSFRARVLSVFNSTIGVGDPMLDSGSTRTIVFTRNTDCTVSVQSDCHLPVAIAGVTWEGEYVAHSRYGR